MSEHYSGNDPETGCVWIAVAGVLASIIVIIVIALYVGLIR